MPLTRSILTETQWRGAFGRLIDEVAQLQNIEPKAVAARLARASGSSVGSRTGDWSRYVNSGRIPTPKQLPPLSDVLRIPLRVLRVCAGYVDDIFDCCFRAAVGSDVNLNLPPSVPPRRAAFALLFGLFPTKKMHLDNRCTLFGWIHGTTVRLNLSEADGYLTGENWNAAWLYPAVFTPEILVEHPPDPNIEYVYVGPPYVPSTYYSVRAEIQVDIASELAKQILSLKATSIPKTSLLFEAKRVLHIKRAPLPMREHHAIGFVHSWANQLDKKLAAEVRESLQQWNQRTLADEAVRWIRGAPTRKPDHLWL